MTAKSNFIVTPNFHDSNTAKVFFAGEQLCRVNDVNDFLFLSENYTASKKTELLIALNSKHGLFHVKEQSKNKGTQLQGVSYMKKDAWVPYDPNFGLDEYTVHDLGVIEVLIASPSKKNFAAFKKENGMYFTFDSNVDKAERKFGIFKLGESESKRVKDELESITGGNINEKKNL